VAKSIYNFSSCAAGIYRESCDTTVDGLGYCDLHNGQSIHIRATEDNGIIYTHNNLTTDCPTISREAVLLLIGDNTEVLAQFESEEESAKGQLARNLERYNDDKQVQYRLQTEQAGTGDQIACRRLQIRARIQRAIDEFARDWLPSHFRKIQQLLSEAKGEGIDVEDLDDVCRKVADEQDRIDACGVTGQAPDSIDLPSQ